jgi:hypothetical protein
VETSRGEEILPACPGADEPDSDLQGGLTEGVMDDQSGGEDVVSGHLDHHSHRREVLLLEAGRVDAAHAPQRSERHADPVRVPVIMRETSGGELGEVRRAPSSAVSTFLWVLQADAVAGEL